MRYHIINASALSEMYCVLTAFQSHCSVSEPWQLTFKNLSNLCKLPAQA